MSMAKWKGAGVWVLERRAGFWPLCARSESLALRGCRFTFTLRMCLFTFEATVARSLMPARPLPFDTSKL